jgi:hypothetical protein
MKRVCFATALGMMLLAAPAVAQSTFGVVGGFVKSEAEVAGDGISISFDSRSGFAIGLSMQHQITPTLSFAPEAMYVTKGFKVESEGDEFGLKFGYLEVPLLLRASFGQAGASARPWIAAGPSVALKLSCDATVTLDDIEAETECTDTEDEDDPAEFKSIDFGIMLGAGVEFGRLGVSVRYDLGMANILDTTEDVTYKNRALMLLGSVRF